MAPTIYVFIIPHSHSFRIHLKVSNKKSPHLANKGQVGASFNYLPRLVIPPRRRFPVSRFLPPAPVFLWELLFLQPSQ